MKQSLLQESYPVYSLEIGTDETSLQNIDEVVAYLKSRIDEHKIANFIAIFDHYAHTRTLEGGQIGEEILKAQNIIFCFGITLPNPEALAYRPRSIGVAELQDRFQISFIQAPMPVANVTMEEWAKSVSEKNPPAA